MTLRLSVVPPGLVCFPDGVQGFRSLRSLVTPGYWQPPLRGEDMKTAFAGRHEFLKRLTAEFPAITAGIDKYSAGLLHCEMGHFQTETERAMDEGRLWETERHFRLVAELFEIAGPELRNALEISYLEGMAFGERTPARHEAIKARMPRHLREILIGHHNQWR